MPRPSQCGTCGLFALCLSPGADGCAEDIEDGRLSYHAQLEKIKTYLREYWNDPFNPEASMEEISNMLGVKVPK